MTRDVSPLPGSPARIASEEKLVARASRPWNHAQDARATSKLTIFDKANPARDSAVCSKRTRGICRRPVQLSFAR